MVDKRRHKRVKVRLNLVVSNIFDQNADMIKIDSPIEVKDVSRSGIGFITKSILPMNYYFNAALTFDDEDSILYSVVKIIRCEALEDDEYSYGCEFVGMAPVLGYIFDKLEKKQIIYAKKGLFTVPFLLPVSLKIISHIYLFDTDY